MKRIAITGCSGFIGTHLSKYLNRKYEIIGIDREFWDAKGLKNISFYHQDINDELPDLDNVYAVIHLAARAGVRESQEHFEEYVKDNILGTKAILDKCVSNWKPKMLLVASSSSVLGDTMDNSVRYTKPKSLYAMTKVATEELVNTYRNNGLLGESGIEASCLRIYTCYGENQRSGLAIRTFIDKILRDEPITIYGDGTQSRDWVLVSDLCQGIEEILELGLSGLEYRDVGTARTHTLNEIIYLIATITGKEVRIRYEPSNRYDVMKTLSPRPCVDRPTPLKEGLEKQIKWQKEQMK